MATSSALSGSASVYPRFVSDVEGLVHSDQAWESFISQWRSDVIAELKSNDHGFLPRKEPKLAQSQSIATFMSTQDDLQVLSRYIWPLTSGTFSSDVIARPAWDTITDMEPIARHLYISSSRAIDITRRYQSLILPGLIVRLLREAALLQDQQDLLRSFRCDDGWHGVIGKALHQADGREPALADGRALSTFQKLGIRLSGLSDRAITSVVLHQHVHYFVQVTAQKLLRRVYEGARERSQASKQDPKASTKEVRLILDSTERCSLEGNMLGYLEKGRDLIMEDIRLARSRDRQDKLRRQRDAEERLAPKRQSSMYDYLERLPRKKAREPREAPSSFVDDTEKSPYATRSRVDSSPRMNGVSTSQIRSGGHDEDHRIILSSSDDDRENDKLGDCPSASSPLAVQSSPLDNQSLSMIASSRIAPLSAQQLSSPGSCSDGRPGAHQIPTRLARTETQGAAGRSTGGSNLQKPMFPSLKPSRAASRADNAVVKLHVASTAQQGSSLKRAYKFIKDQAPEEAASGALQKRHR